MKRKPGSLKWSPLKKGSKIKQKPKTPEQIQQRKEDYKKMWALFNEHWNTKPRRCESCGTILYGENKSLYHHHLLPKGLDRYKHLKYEIDNLMMLCTKCHTAHENGISSIAIQDKTEWARKRFGI